jgi:hypothetical protein
MNYAAIIRLSCLLVIMSLMGCNSDLPPEDFPLYLETKPFDPRKISCDVHPIKAAQEQVAQFIKYSVGFDINRIKKADQSLRSIQVFADQGDPDSMFYFGMTRYYGLAIVLLYRTHDDKQRRPYPEIYRDDLVTGITYILIAAEIPSGRQKEAQEFKYKKVPFLKKGGLIPATWVEEAEENVRSWKELCGRE